MISSEGGEQAIPKIVATGSASFAVSWFSTRRSPTTSSASNATTEERRSSGSLAGWWSATTPPTPSSPTTWRPATTRATRSSCSGTVGPDPRTSTPTRARPTAGASLRIYFAQGDTAGDQPSLETRLEAIDVSPDGEFEADRIEVSSRLAEISNVEVASIDGMHVVASIDGMHVVAWNERNDDRLDALMQNVPTPKRDLPTQPVG